MGLQEEWRRSPSSFALAFKCFCREKPDCLSLSHDRSYNDEKVLDGMVNRYHRLIDSLHGFWLNWCSLSSPHSVSRFLGAKRCRSIWAQYPSVI